MCVCVCVCVSVREEVDVGALFSALNFFRFIDTISGYDWMRGQGLVPHGIPFTLLGLILTSLTDNNPRNLHLMKDLDERLKNGTRLVSV